MKGAQGWAVVVHDDNVNSYESVAYAVHAVLGLSYERGIEFADAVQEHGLAELTHFPAREQAEELVAQLQVLGLHAGLQGR